MLKIRSEAFTAIRLAARRGPPTTLAEAIDVSVVSILSAAVGLVRADTFGDFWEPSEDGQLFLTVPAIGWSEVVDLVVFRLDTPERWWVRTGYAKALGLDDAAIVRAATPIWRLPGDPLPPSLPVFATPLSWLRNDAAGVVILHEKWAEYVLGGIDAIIAEDSNHARHLHAALLRCSGPKVRLRREHAAA